MIKILLVDKYPIFLSALKALLEDSNDIKVVGTATNGKEALDFIREKKVDVVVTELELPVMDGMDLIAVLTKKYPEIAALALTMYEDEKLIVHTLKMGARGYLVKTCTATQLIEVIQKVANTGHYYSELVTKVLHKNLTGKIKQVSGLTKGTAKFSEREIEVIQLISEGHATAAIANKLFLSTGTIDSVRHSLLKKAGVNNTAELVGYAIRNGVIE